jgi:hypothetical protein
MSEQRSTDLSRHPGAWSAIPFRRILLGSSLVGLLLNGLLAACATWLVTSGSLKVLLPQPLIALLLAVIFGGLSLAEIPVMVFAMRHLLATQQGHHAFVLGLNVLFIFFAAVYGTPVLLLTGSLAWGWILCGLGLVRLAASQLFVREGSHPIASDDGKGIVP